MKKVFKGKLAYGIFSVALVAVIFFLNGCSESDATAELEVESNIGSEYETLPEEMNKVGSMELRYAEQFSVDYYDNGCALIEISECGRFLLMPESMDNGQNVASDGLRESMDDGQNVAPDGLRESMDDGQNVVPDGLPEDIVVLRKPVGNIYLAASAAMDHFCKLEALNSVSLSSIKADGWYIDEAKAAMEAGRIIYAGKYNTPDYELILEAGCELALESMMISHSPEVKENLENNGIPVMIDRSSYEPHPLGRSEWVKLYGLLTGREDEAEAIFRQQVEMVDSAAKGNTGKTVAFFYITSSGGVNVRKSGDYVSKMIELAGGQYVFDDLGDDETATATEVIQMEEFYAAAKEADYLIYNSTVDGELRSIGDLLAKSSLLKDFKAVQQGNVYCTGKNMYQETSETGRMILDINKMLYGEDEEIEFLYKLEV